MMNYTPPPDAQVKPKNLRNTSRRGSGSGPRWVPDKEVKACPLCSTTFNLIRRKHHCRHCGAIYCDRCSTRNAYLPMNFKCKEMKRVCDPCFVKLKPMQNEIHRTLTAALNQDVFGH